MIAPEKEPSDYTVADLKDVLRFLNLPTTGTKAELITRIDEADSTVWQRMPEILRKPVDEGPTALVLNDQPSSGDERGIIATRNERSSDLSVMQRELRLLRREKEILERELQLVRRESEARTESALSNSSRQTSRSTFSISSIGDLLREFDGANDSFQNWTKQIELLRRTYGLDDDSTKVLMGTKLKGKALRWFHSKPDHLGMSVTELIEEMQVMFDHRPSRLVLRKEFEQRVWQNNEIFSDYYHDKIILANRVPIDEAEIVDYIIDGIQDGHLRNQARMQCFQTGSELLQAFKKIDLRAETRSYDRRNVEKRETRHYPEPQRSDGPTQPYAVRCFNCNERGHVSTRCPRPRRERTSCSGCGGTDHRLSECPRRRPPLSNTTNLIQSGVRAPYTLPVKYVVTDEGGNVCNYEVLALVDSGSPVSLIKSNYVPSGARSPTSFNDHKLCGINGSELITLGAFRKDVHVGGIEMLIDFLIVPDETITCAALLGRDFMSNPNIKITMGESLEIARNIPDRSSDESVEFCEEIMHIDLRDKPSRVSETLDVCPDVGCDVASKLEDLYTSTFGSDLPAVLHDFEITITLKHDQPISFRPRRLSLSEKKKLRALLDNLMKDCVIRPSDSPYTSPSKWDKALDSVEFAMNNTVCRSIGETASRLLYGVNQLGKVNDRIRLLLEEQSGDNRDLEKLRGSASENMHKSQRINAEYYNKRYKSSTQYKIGDYVMIRNVDTTPGANKKLIPKFKGPYVIREALQHDRYIVGDIEGLQLTQMPFESIVGTDQMKYWL